MSDEPLAETPATGEPASGSKTDAVKQTSNTDEPEKPKEFGGREGPEPTRYGDWENKGIISDF